MDEDAERPAAGVRKERVAAAIGLEPGINPAPAIERNRLRPLAGAARDALYPFEQLVARIGSGIGGGRWLGLPCHRLDADGREQQKGQDRAEKTKERKKQDAHGGSVCPSIGPAVPRHACKR